MAFAVRRRPRLTALFLVVIVAVEIATGGSASAAVWLEAALPAAAHFGPPSTGFEWGLRADGLWVTPIGADSGQGGRPRLGVGPYLEARVLGHSEFGVGGGIELGGFSSGGSGLVLRTGVSRWVTSNQGLGTLVGGSLGAQLRLNTKERGVSWTPSFGPFVAANRSTEVDRWEVIAGVEFGGALIPLLIMIAFGNHD